MVNLIFALSGTALLFAAFMLIPLVIIKTISGLMLGLAGIYTLLLGLTYKGK